MTIHWTTLPSPSSCTSTIAMESFTIRTSEQSLLASSPSWVAALPDFGTKEFIKEWFCLNCLSKRQELLLEYKIRGNPVLNQIGEPLSNEEADLKGSFTYPNFKELQFLSRICSL